ncbi:hypothetical protein B0H15DRAFT_948238 [Mycena belliarum]|uniref:Uncharacterized protein n=1 Tax=Mycena belliarum TaxID=1033014 RepID=A0AAD6U5V8_9AGAR|nr:hypothetical protein B0H15DRAFT_948238 [Mycena belliae]
MERERSVAVGGASSARSISRPPPPPPALFLPATPPPVQIKKIIEVRRKQREANKALEDERQRERWETEPGREREPEKKDVQGASVDIEAVPPFAPAKPEDLLAPVLDDIRHDAMSEKPQPLPVHTQVHEDVMVEMPKRKMSPLIVNAPAMLNGVSKPTISSSLLKLPSSFVKMPLSPWSPLPSVSEGAALSLAPLHKHKQRRVEGRSSTATEASPGLSANISFWAPVTVSSAHPSPHGPRHPPSSTTRLPSQEEGKILCEPPPPMLTPVAAPVRTAPFVFGSIRPLSPRCPPPLPARHRHSLARTRPICSALREVQTLPARARPARGSGSGEQSMAGDLVGSCRVLEPPRERGNWRGHHNRKQH